MTHAPSSAAEKRDDDLEPVDPVSVASEPSPLLFWNGLVLGLVLSAVAWALLATVAFALYRLVTG